MPVDMPFILPTLTSWGKSKMLGYAKQVLLMQQQLTLPDGKNILHHTLQKNRRHKAMNHYPKGDRIDHTTGAQYFYHCHRENKKIQEHGHFHCFLRYKHIPKHIRPTPLSDWKKNLDNPMTHLVAIGMNRYGQPIRLFTVNRWITSEIWYDAEHLSNFIKRFNMTLTDDPYWQPLDNWVESMLKLFSPQIAWLHYQRDALMAERQLTHPEQNHYEDQSLEELSSIPIELNNQIQWILNTKPSHSSRTMPHAPDVLSLTVPT